MKWFLIWSVLGAADEDALDGAFARRGATKPHVSSMASQPRSSTINYLSPIFLQRREQVSTAPSF